MNKFVAFHYGLGLPVSCEGAFGGFFVMSEGHELQKIEDYADFIYLGEEGAKLHPTTILNMISLIRRPSGPEAVRLIENFTAAMKRYGFRCDPETDICQLEVFLKEVGYNDWTFGIYDETYGRDYIIEDGVGESYAREVTRAIIESAIALGIDLRTNWNVKRLETVTETPNQKQDE